MSLAVTLIAAVLIYSAFIFSFYKNHSVLYWIYLFLSSIFVYFGLQLDVNWRIVLFELLFWFYLIIIKQEKPEKLVVFFISTPFLVFVPLFFKTYLYLHQGENYLWYTMIFFLALRLATLFKDFNYENLQQYFGIQLALFYIMAPLTFSTSVGLLGWSVIVFILGTHYYMSNNFIYLIQILLIPLLVGILNIVGLQISPIFYCLPLIYHLGYLILQNTKQISMVSASALLIFIIPDFYLLKKMNSVWQVDNPIILSLILVLLLIWIVTKFLIFHRNFSKLAVKYDGVAHLPFFVMTILYWTSGALS